MPFKRTWEGIKIDKITEEVITSLIRRIEILEAKVNKSNTSNTNKNKPGMATQKQIDFIKGLGGNTWKDMTSKDAGELIDKLLAKKNNPKKSEEKEESDLGTFESKPLTKEEIDEIGEEALL